MAVHDLRQAGATESVTIHLLEQKNKKQKTKPQYNRILVNSTHCNQIMINTQFPVEYASMLRSCVISRHWLNLLNSAHSFHKRELSRLVHGSFNRLDRCKTFTSSTNSLLCYVIWTLVHPAFQMFLSHPNYAHITVSATTSYAVIKSTDN